MHEEDINVVQSQGIERSLQCLGGIVMPFTPELGDHRDLAARDTTGPHSFSDCWLHAIVLRGVDETITTSKGVDNGDLKLFLSRAGGGA